MAKSVILSYIFWLFGGWFGLHHFYLGRDSQCFLWWATWGGFGIGWLRDAVRIPEYVADANGKVDHVEEVKALMRYYRVPPFSTFRFAGELTVAMLFSYLTKAAMPEYLMEELNRDFYYVKLLLEALVPYACALGVHMVASIGRERASMKVALASAYLAFPFLLMNDSFVTHMCLMTAIGVNWKGKSWQPGFPGRKRKNICLRIPSLGLCLVVYYSLWASCIFHNSFVTTQDGEKIPLKDALKNFFTSPAWATTKETFWHLVRTVREKGIRHLYYEFVAALDPEGEGNAYKVLDVPPGASESEISSKYRQLVREWHPDKHKTGQQEAAKKFMEIQQAYETLSKIKNRRAQASKRSSTEAN